MAYGIWGAVTRDTFNLDQVEVAKGPAGADIGRGAASGYINLVTKLPAAEEFNSGTVGWNSANNKRVTADLNKKIGETSAIRLNVMNQNGGVVGRDHVENNGSGIAPSLAVGLGTPTRFYLYSQHIRQDNVPDGGVPSIGLEGFFNADNALRTGARVDQKNYYGSTNDYEKVNADMVTAKIEHDLGKGVVLRNIARYGKSSMDRVLTGVNAPTAVVAANPATWTVARTRQRTDQENEILANQTNLTAEFATGAIQHSLSTGLELMYEKQTTKGFSSTGLTIPAANLYNPNANVLLPVPFASGADSTGSTTTAAVYVFDTLKLTDRWQVNGGLRFERYDTDSSSISLSTVCEQSSVAGQHAGACGPGQDG